MKTITHIIHAGIRTCVVCILMLGLTSNLISQTAPQDSTQINSDLSSKENSKPNKKVKTKAVLKNKGFRASYIGILGGAGYYNVSFSPSFSPVPTGGISPVFGVSYRFESPVNKSIEVELRYRTSGWEVSNIYERNLGIIDLPVIAHISFGKKQMKGFFTLGETVTFILSDKEKILDPTSNPIYSEQPVENTVGFALNLGVGVIRHFKKSAVQFEVRGTFTITNIYKPDNELLLDNSNALFIEGAIKYLFRVK